MCSAARWPRGRRSSTGGTHEGHPGWRISQITNLVGTCTIRRFRPNVVTLHIGTNDLKVDQDVDVAAAAGRLRALIDTILDGAPETTVLVATLVPSLKPVPNGRIQEYNTRMQGIVDGFRSAGKPVRLVSMSAVTTADMADWLHPNTTGYRKMADAFNRGIDAAMAEGLIVPPVAGASALPPADKRRCCVRR
ncbi:SGNH/GDSL hydrolase family protein [Dactylosporangium sp. NPDC050588]|uniref:SGNH/GDSL hydrolase family protein n=1 Tax=Dactylosporangium sp. NPDC050588 TaxID=3157211 RepID=UPI003403F7AD